MYVKSLWHPVQHWVWGSSIFDVVTRTADRSLWVHYKQQQGMLRCLQHRKQQKHLWHSAMTAHGPLKLGTPYQQQYCTQHLSQTCRKGSCWAC